MTTTGELLADGFDRARLGVHEVLDGIAQEHLTARLGPGANTIAWLVWHLTRVQDDHVAAAAGTTQLWASGWAQRFDLNLPLDATGYGADDDEVAAVTAPADLLRDYHDAVHAQTRDWVLTLSDPELDRVVDEDWDPPVTLGVRLVSVLDDDLQHVGQAAYVRGVLQAAP